MTSLNGRNSMNRSAKFSGVYTTLVGEGPFSNFLSAFIMPDIAT